MNYASLELCKELYEVSQWGYNETDKVWCHGKLKNKGLIDTREVHEHLPAYSLGYLLEKLPHHLNGYHLNMWAYPDDNASGWAFSYYSASHNTVAKNLPQRGDDNPANAACKLAIALFKQHILPQQPTKGSGGA